MKQIVMLIIAATALVACATAPKSQLSEMEDYSLCTSLAWAYGVSQSLVNEVLKRGLLTTDELAAVGNRQLKMGMSECAAYGAFGPDAVGVPHQAVSDKNGKLIYKIRRFRCDTEWTENLPYCPITEVEIRDDKIVAIRPYGPTG